ncbi:thiamine pyrophosphokinase [Drepanopeziza brunnea f. sp. 'multigermtubi' MB_m1]|uniref:Thiamine pyrophosphokinase n=1 Tax=Marssonina brunnea f. sp. multigermtubi (strain MB_m1) TaxID=1072389 RepID=K1X013_MARBU|nr:thiamine pyrophosphokinase [Drepanopeziza brunnea f. sp. 'multigermtubi' MB_m1]EKD18297.1 thiamine pyrophosphokinase [Drepanopeziza brunnea f. sp. 'multigermtubi' MB_m1]
MAMDPVTSWQPADIFSATPKNHKPFAIIILNQALGLPASVYARLWASSIFKVAADGGANCLHDLNAKNGTDLSVDAVIGDLDSLLPEVRKHWEDMSIPVIHDPDQYSTDFGKAVKYIRSSPDRAAIDIVVIGGLGGRVDQGMATLSHLYTFQKEPNYVSGRMYLLSSESITFVLKTGKHRIKVKERYEGIELGRHVGIIPLKEPSVISTQGLEWDVNEWGTEFGGQMSTSNHVKEDEVEVQTTKDVLFTIDLDTPNASLA